MEPLKKLFQMLLLLSAAFFIGSSNRCVHGSDSDSDSDGFSELFIDCGASGETTISFNGVDTHWYEDKDFINTGKNFILTPTEVVNPMNSLRFFPSDNKSCYKLPLQPFNGKFLFRAGFFYGNYDGLSRPSSFKLEIDGNLWANVTTSMIQDQPVYHELIYRTASEKTTVCLVRTTDNGVAFISSLQATYMPGDMYTLMQNKTALYLQSRINFGANKTVENEEFGPVEECCNRIWKPQEMPEYLNISGDPMLDGYSSLENSPPFPVLLTAIQAKSVSDSIYLPVNFSSQTEVVAYFVIYFMDPIIRFEIGEVEIYIDGQKFNARDVDVPNWATFGTENNVVSLYPVRVSGSANVTISPANGSTLPPLVNAMEVFQVLDVVDDASNGGHLLGFSLPMFVFATSFHLLRIFFPLFEILSRVTFN